MGAVFDVDWRRRGVRWEGRGKSGRARGEEVCSVEGTGGKRERGRGKRGERGADCLEKGGAKDGRDI